MVVNHSIDPVDRVTMAEMRSMVTSRRRADHGRFANC